LPLLLLNHKNDALIIFTGVGFHYTPKFPQIHTSLSFISLPRHFFFLTFLTCTSMASTFPGRASPCEAQPRQPVPRRSPMVRSSPIPSTVPLAPSHGGMRPSRQFMWSLSLSLSRRTLSPLLTVPKPPSGSSMILLSVTLHVASLQPMEMCHVISIRELCQVHVLMIFTLV
jgi:hypothetical protein